MEFCKDPITQKIIKFNRIETFAVYRGGGGVICRFQCNLGVLISNNELYRIEILEVVGGC